MRLRNNTILPNLKRKAMAPVLYERIDENNVRIGTKWFKYKPSQVTIIHGKYMDWEIDKSNEGVTIYHDPGTKQFIANNWYDINTSGTYEEFEMSFELWIKRL